MAREIQIPHASPITVGRDSDDMITVEFDPEILGVGDSAMFRLDLDPRRAMAFGEALAAEAEAAMKDRPPQ